MAGHPALRHISKSSIKPLCVLGESKQHFHLGPMDLPYLSLHAMQMGLLFPKPPASSVITTIIIIDHLKDSLSRTLVHFFPLAGNLVTHKQDDSPCYSISLEYSPGGGVDFVHAVAEDVTMADVLSSIDVHPIFQLFFLLNNAINHDGHTLPLLAVQVTQLLDGIFIACSFNHAIGDGTSFWHFFDAWAEMCRNMVLNDDHMMISHPPVLKRWFLDGYDPIINLPFSHHDEFIDRYLPPMVLRERFFHFSPQSIAMLKAKANAECNTSTISSFQALSALLWRSVTRARRHLPSHQKTTCLFGIDIRSRLNPPLSPDYFGCYAQDLSPTATVEELLSHGIGWAAWLLHESVNGHTDSKVQGELEVWMKRPSITQFRDILDPCSVTIQMSPRFNMYGCDFGWGRAEAVRSGPAYKSDGFVTSCPGRQGGGSVDLGVCLLPECMSALESDPEFMDVVSSPSQQHQMH